MTVPAVTAPYLAAVALLGLAGVSKLARPNDTARALQIAGLPASRTWVRAGAAGEVLVAVVAFAVPGAVTGALVAASYAAFTAFNGTGKCQRARGYQWYYRRQELPPGTEHV